MPELPLVAPWETSSAASTQRIESRNFDNSRATVAPQQPPPMMMASYDPFGFAAELRLLLRGQGVVVVVVVAVDVQPLQLRKLSNVPSQSSISSHSPPKHVFISHYIY
jgi:hypothetical protein